MESKIESAFFGTPAFEDRSFPSRMKPFRPSAEKLVTEKKIIPRGRGRKSD
jgi:hypothetical protein